MLQSGANFNHDLDQGSVGNSIHEAREKKDLVQVWIKTKETLPKIIKNLFEKIKLAAEAAAEEAAARQASAQTGTAQSTMKLHEAPVLTPLDDLLNSDLLVARLQETGGVDATFAEFLKHLPAIAKQPSRSTDVFNEMLCLQAIQHGEKTPVWDKTNQAKVLRQALELINGDHLKNKLLCEWLVRNMRQVYDALKVPMESATKPATSYFSPEQLTKRQEKQYQALIKAMETAESEDRQFTLVDLFNFVSNSAELPQQALNGNSLRTLASNLGLRLQLIPIKQRLTSDALNRLEQPVIAQATPGMDSREFIKLYVSLVNRVPDVGKIQKILEIVQAREQSASETRASSS